jgi:hypothetical protein
MAPSLEAPRTERQVRSLPLELWPQADRDAWKAACHPPARLQRGGAAGHLKPVTRADHERSYGSFLCFLDRCGLLRPDVPSATNVTVSNVNAYVAELKGRVGSVHRSIRRLRLVAQFIAPERDFTWLSEIGEDLESVARPRSKFDRLVLPEVLVEAGLTLIQEAAQSQMTKLARACQVRSGLMVALLALCPIRRKNFAALEIGRSFVKIRGTWWIVLSASETKEGAQTSGPLTRCSHLQLSVTFASTDRCWRRGQITHPQPSGCPLTTVVPSLQSAV